MKLKLKIQKEVQLTPEVVEEKINTYLRNNFYRTVERGQGFVIFIEDEYSDRKHFQSDYHTRIGEGKFEFYVNHQGTAIKLICLTEVLYPIFVMTLFAAFGAYIKSFAPILASFAFSLPIIFKIYYLKAHVFSEIFEC